MRNRSISSRRQHFFESPLDALDGFAHDMNLIVEIVGIVRIGDCLKGIADVVIHKLDGPEPLNERTAAALLVKENQQSNSNCDQQIVDGYDSRIQSCMLEDAIKQPAE